MKHYAAFHLSLHCLPKYPLRGFQYTKVNAACNFDVQMSSGTKSSFFLCMPVAKVLVMMGRCAGSSEP